MRVAVVASAQIFGGFQNLPPPQSLDFPAFFGLSHLFPPRLSISVIFDTDLVTLHYKGQATYLDMKDAETRSVISTASDAYECFAKCGKKYMDGPLSKSKDGYRKK